MIKSVTIHGLRGFGQERTIQFAIPNDTLGSGLTILVGGNNTGKTTILEALRAFNAPKDDPTTFSEKKRNINCEEGTVHLKLETTEDDIFLIDTIDKGSTSTYKKLNISNDEWWQSPEVFVLQSRRFVDYEFNRTYMERGDYVRNQQMNLHNRSATIYEFNARLFKMQRNKAEFDKLLKEVLGYDLKWTIEQNENGMYYLKLIVNGCMHSSEGLGDGIWSVFTICDALYDSEPGSVIAIDEPELSLHPAYQKRIMKLFNDFAKDRQIIINTHLQFFKEAIITAPSGEKKNWTDEELEAYAKKLLMQMDKAGEKERKYTYISCWHSNNYESEAMWKLYAVNVTNAIAIQTTTRRLYEALDRNPYIDIGKIKYIDYRNTFAPVNGSYWYKRKAFEHEREVRAILRDHRHTGLGVAVPVDTEKLIERIYISPYAPKWFEEVVYSVMEKYSIDKPVVRSDMMDKPFY